MTAHATPLHHPRLALADRGRGIGGRVRAALHVAHYNLCERVVA
jgi:hypothetical protein